MYHNNEISIINLPRFQCIVSVSRIKYRQIISVQIFVSEILVKSGIGPSLLFTTAGNLYFKEHS